MATSPLYPSPEMSTRSPCEEHEFVSKHGNYIHSGGLKGECSKVAMVYAVTIGCVFGLVTLLVAGVICHVSMSAACRERRYKRANKPKSADRVYVKYWDTDDVTLNTCPTCQTRFHHADNLITNTPPSGQRTDKVVMPLPSENNAGQAAKPSRIWRHLRSSHDNLDTCITPCGHTFHLGCLQLSLKPTTTTAGKCPVCRSPANLGQCYVVARQDRHVQPIHAVHIAMTEVGEGSHGCTEQEESRVSCAKQV